MSGTFDDFRSFLIDFRSVSSWVAKVAIASPFLDLLLNIGAPWPSRIAVSSLAAVVQSLVLMAVFEFLGHSTVETGRRVFAVSAASFVAALMVYIACFSSFVKPAGSEWNRDVIGFVYLDVMREYIQKRGDNPDAESLLGDFKRVEKIWTGWSITIARVVVLFFWIVMWVALSSGIASFVAVQRLRAS